VDPVGSAADSPGGETEADIELDIELFKGAGISAGDVVGPRIIIGAAHAISRAGRGPSRWTGRLGGFDAIAYELPLVVVPVVPSLAGAAVIIVELHAGTSEFGPLEGGDVGCVV